MLKIKRIKIYFITSFVAAILVSGFIGYLIGNKNLVLSASHVPQIVNKNLGAPDDIDFSLFWQAYSKLKSDYFGQIDATKFLYGAISGGFNSLGDPYTTFLSPDESTALNQELSGDLEGIGVKLGVLDDLPAVIAPLPNSPGQKAGLKPKDKITAVDGVSTANLNLDEVVLKIRGKEGTEVKLTILREGEISTRDFTIQREKISVKSVELNYSGDTAIVAINEFGTDTSQDFAAAAKEISDKGISKVVIDLRNNPGGLLDSAVQVAGEIFEKGTLVTTEQGKDYKSELRTTGEGILKQAKINVIVNGGSASAAEILAGAIKDNGRGKIIGEKTFGKGTVQQLEDLSGGSTVKVTIAKWLTPSGLSIDKNGIEPDETVKEPDNILFLNPDPLVQKAIEAL